MALNDAQALSALLGLLKALKRGSDPPYPLFHAFEQSLSSKQTFFLESTNNFNGYDKIYPLDNYPLKRKYEKKEDHVFWSPAHNFQIGVAVECTILGNATDVKKYTLVKRVVRKSDFDFFENEDEYEAIPKFPVLIENLSYKEPVLGPIDEDFLDLAGILSENSSQTLQRTTTPPSGSFFPQDTIVNGDLVVSGGCEMSDVVVRGNLIVEGEIRGQLVTQAGQADYAEWFGFLNKNEVISAGDVVQLRSPEQEITLDTSNEDCGPILVVSTSPSIAAGKPVDREDGDFCAFLGQVPVKVHGPVKCGDLLFPSGLNDGFAESHRMHYKNLKKKTRNGNLKNMEPIATALESCSEGDFVILTFVRWQHNAKNQFLKEQNQGLELSSPFVGAVVLILLFDLVASSTFYFSQRNFVGFMVILLDLFLSSFWFSRLFSKKSQKLFSSKQITILCYLKAYRFLQANVDCIHLLTSKNDGDQKVIRGLFVNTVAWIAAIFFLLLLIDVYQAWKRVYPNENKSSPFLPFFRKLVAEIVEIFPTSVTNQSQKKRK